MCIGCHYIFKQILPLLHTCDVVKLRDCDVGVFAHHVPPQGVHATRATGALGLKGVDVGEE